MRLMYNPSSLNNDREPNEEFITKMLRDCGYVNPKKIHGNEYSVDSVGIHLHSVSILDRNPYGTIIQNAMERENFTAKNIADLTLTNEIFVLSVLEGRDWFSSSELNSVGRALNLNTVSLIHGEQQPRTSKQMLDDIIGDLENRQISLNAYVDTVQKEIAELKKDDRFIPTSANRPDYNKLISVYVIYDRETGSYVSLKDGNQAEFANLSDAYRVSNVLENEWKKANKTAELEAWEKVNETFPTDYKFDPARTESYKNNVFSSTSETNANSYIVDYGDEISIYTGGKCEQTIPVNRPDPFPVILESKSPNDIISAFYPENVKVDENKAVASEKESENVVVEKASEKNNQDQVEIEELDPDGLEPDSKELSAMEI